VFVIVGNNPAKKYMFTGQERANMVHRVIGIDDYDRFVVDFLHNDLLINVAHDSECNFLIRGIRNSEDFNYEGQVLLINRKIRPGIETLFLIPPRELTEVSSSTVKGLVGFNGWEDVVSTYVHPVVLDALKTKVRK
jgi:pantetheine-phosphate adenylyltransferase